MLDKIIHDMEITMQHPSSSSLPEDYENLERNILEMYRNAARDLAVFLNAKSIIVKRPGFFGWLKDLFMQPFIERPTLPKIPKLLPRDD